LSGWGGGWGVALWRGDPIWFVKFKYFEDAGFHEGVRPDPRYPGSREAHQKAVEEIDRRLAAERPKITGAKTARWELEKRGYQITHGFFSRKWTVRTPQGVTVTHDDDAAFLAWARGELNSA
jgi:hypothetical protein